MDPKETRFTRALDRRVLAWVRSQGLLARGERVLVAVSGGPDSTTLLLVLARLRPQLDLALGAAHFDHGLRSREEARDEAAFVTELGRTLGIEVHTASGDTRALARRERRSIEDAARALRYGFLAGVAREQAAAVVATGHTADDQAETVLLRIIRGTGIRGLGGMRGRDAWPFPSEHARPDVVRPLLDLSREETERYCAESGVRPRRDPSNVEWQYARNRVRQSVLPVLRGLNPSVDAALRRLATAAREASDFIEAEAARRWDHVAEAGPAAVTVRRAAFREQPGALQSALLRRAVVALLGDDQGFGRDHLDAMRGAALAAGSGARVDLPRGLVWLVERDRCVLGPRLPPGGEGAVALGELPLPGSGTLHLPGGDLDVEVVPGSAFRRPGDRSEAWLDRAALGHRPVVRSRRPGDRMRPLGLGGEKKLQDLLVDAKVPAAERDLLPLVVATDGWVAWAAGVAVDERARVRPESGEAYRLRWRRTGTAENLGEQRRLPVDRSRRPE